LLGKLWGKSLLYSTTIGHAKLTWHAIAGEVEEMDMGNGWIYLKFSVVEDRNYI